MRSLVVALITSLMLVPVVADSHEAACEERLREVEQRMEQRLENVSSDEERIRLNEELDERLESIEDECESAEQSSSTLEAGPENASQQAEESYQPLRDPEREVTPDSVVDWSEEYPDVSPVGVKDVSLSDDQFDTVKKNVLKGLGDAEDHLPDGLTQGCVEEVVTLASQSKERLQDASSLDSIMAEHRETTQDIEGILSSNECRREQPSDQSDETAPGVLEGVGAGSSLSESQISELRERFAELQETLENKQQRIKQLEGKVESLLGRLERRQGGDQGRVAEESVGVADIAEEPSRPDRVDTRGEDDLAADTPEAAERSVEGSSGEQRVAQQEVVEESPGEADAETVVEDEPNRSIESPERGEGDAGAQEASNESEEKGLIGQVTDALFG